MKTVKAVTALAAVIVMLGCAGIATVSTDAHARNKKPGQPAVKGCNLSGWIVPSGWTTDETRYFPVTGNIVRRTRSCLDGMFCWETFIEHPDGTTEHESGCEYRAASMKAPGAASVLTGPTRVKSR